MSSSSSSARHHGPALWILLLTYALYVMLFATGYIKDFGRKLLSFFVKSPSDTPPGYAPLLRDFEEFYRRHAYRRIADCWNRPICSVPGPRMDVMARRSLEENMKFEVIPGKMYKGTINLGSYNYLGFAETRGKCIEDAMASLDEYGTSTCSPAAELGYTALHQELEQKIAEFVGKEAALIFGMGFATNSTVLPAIAPKGTLIISDSLNHSSLVVGARSGAGKIRVFKHGDVKDLERIVRESIVDGQPRTHRPWDRIWILVEGVYSMEGHSCNLPAIVAIKKKYKCYLYVDEAHSIGALGRTGHGVCEHHGVDPADVDILMGTFTKSFASVGGYISGPRTLIDHLRRTTFGYVYSCNMPPGCVRMALSALEIIKGEDGTTDGQRRLNALKWNSNYFRDRLIEMGFMVMGEHDSPIIPVLTYMPTIMPLFSRECLKRNVGIVVVGFPATSVVESRVRFCISAAHTVEMLDEALEVIEIVGGRCMTKYCLHDTAARQAATARLAKYRAAIRSAQTTVKAS